MTDDSFVIFTSANWKGPGLSDLWVSFNKDGKWSDPVNMGDKVQQQGN